MQPYTTPSAMMRKKRLYLFSDSERMEAYRLSKSELRLHLDSLTNRNQHKDFENFCRKLAEQLFAASGGHTTHCGKKSSA